MLENSINKDISKPLRGKRKDAGIIEDCISIDIDYNEIIREVQQYVDRNERE